MKKFNWLEKRLTPGTKPHKFVGIEFEVLSKSSPITMINAFSDANLEKYINLSTDNSIDLELDEGYEYPHEIRCLIPQKQYKEIVKKICKVLVETDCKSNESCGLHVHLDMRRKTKRNVNEAYEKLVENIPVLKRMVAQHRVDEPYSEFNRTKDFKEALYGKTIIMQRQALHKTRRTPRFRKGQPVMENYEIRSDAEGRAAINPHSFKKHKTLEVRMKEGTVNKTEVIKWVDRLIKIVDGKAA